MSLLLDTGVNSSLEVAGGLHGTSKERSGLLQGEREREKERMVRLQCVSEDGQGEIFSFLLRCSQALTGVDPSSLKYERESLEVF